MIDKTKNEEVVEEGDEEVLVQCNLVDNNINRNSEVSYTFRPYKSHVYLLNVVPSNSVFLKAYTTEFDDIIIIFTDQNARPLEIEDKS